MQNRSLLERLQPLLSLFLLLAFGAFGVALMFKVTSNGPGVSPDSVVYIETAKNILAGKGFYALGVPMTHYPPGYPLLLALDSIFESRDLYTGRILQCVLFGANIILVGIAIQIGTRKNLVAMILGMTAFLCCATAISIHAWAWSEPAYIAFSLAGLILVSYYLVRPSRFMLLAVSLTFGFAMLIRYVGVTLLPPMVFGLLVFGDRTKREKIQDALLAVLIASLPLLIWLVYNQSVVGTSTNRAFATHLVTIEDIKLLILTTYTFILALDISRWVQALHLGVLASFFLAGIVVLYKKKYLRANMYSSHIILSSLSLLYFLTYVIFLLISKSFLDESMYFGNRLLFPGYIFLAISVISVMWSVSQALNNRMVWGFFILFTLFCISVTSEYAISASVGIHRTGLGYTAQEWQSSPTIAYVNTIGEDVEIYSNGFDAIRLLTKKEAVSIPLHNDPTSGLRIPNYQDQLNSLCDKLQEGKAVVIYFDSIKRWFLPTARDLISSCGIHQIEKFDDAKVYGAGN